MTDVGLGEPGVPPPQYIKPEHLSTVISASHADFLIVIGDRNMKNETCQVRYRRVLSCEVSRDPRSLQARRAGKLVEMRIDERIGLLLESWAAQTGLRLGGEAGDSDRVIAGLPEPALWERLKRITGVSHAQERMKRLAEAAQEVAEWRRPSRRGGGLVGDAAAMSDGDQNMVRALSVSCPPRGAGG